MRDSKDSLTTEVNTSRSTKEKQVRVWGFKGKEGSSQEECKE